MSCINLFKKNIFSDIIEDQKQTGGQDDNITVSDLLQTVKQKHGHRDIGKNIKTGVWLVWVVGV
jgi:hypothetical protein